MTIWLIATAPGGIFIYFLMNAHLQQEGRIALQLGLAEDEPRLFLEINLPAQGKCSFDMQAVGRQFRDFAIGMADHAPFLK